MPDIASDLEFEKQIEGFTRAEQFIARQVRSIETNCPACIEESNKRSRHAIGIGSLSGIIGGTIVFVIQYLTGHKA